MIVHNVFFWLKETNDNSISRFSEQLRRLGAIKEVEKMNIGIPADISRPVVDSSYTVGLVVHFNSLNEHNIYQSHPVHQEFLANNKDLWSKVQIYDIEVK